MEGSTELVDINGYGYEGASFWSAQCPGAPCCLKGFIGCTARPIGPLYSPFRGLFTAPWNDL